MSEKPIHKSKKAKAPWEKPNPKKGKSKPLNSAQKAEARAKKAGRRYPNLVDNMAVAGKK